MIVPVVASHLRPPAFPDSAGPFPRLGGVYGFSITNDAELLIGTGSIRLRVSFRSRPGDLDMESAREPMPMKAWIGQLQRNDASLRYKLISKRWRSITLSGKITLASLTLALAAEMNRRHLSELVYLGVVHRAEQFEWTVPSRVAAERKEPFVGQPGDLRIIGRMSSSQPPLIVFWRPDGTEAGILDKLAVPKLTIFVKR